REPSGGQEILPPAGTAAGAPTTDQRGLGRVGAVDVGALEVQNQASTIQALHRAGALSAGQAEALVLNLRDNNGDAGKVQAFLHQVQAFLSAAILNQEQADALLEPGNMLLLSVTRR